MGKLALIAIGGNSLIIDKNHQKVEDQLAAICNIASHIADFIMQGWQVVITHGNGPQVGFILRRSEIAFESKELHFVPLKNCVADTQGALGYQIQESLVNAFRERGIVQSAVSLVTQVEVDPDDPSFLSPSKPIGSIYSREKAAALSRKNKDWKFSGDAESGYRRVVASPRPKRIVELDAIKALVSAHFCVIAAGGGGIATVVCEDGSLRGVDAVIDKDFSSGLLAMGLGADSLIILTAVDRAYLYFNQKNQKGIDRMTLDQTRQFIDEGHFAAGSMQPKITAAVEFIKNGGRKAIITCPEKLLPAVHNRAGTHIVA